MNGVLGRRSIRKGSLHVLVIIFVLGFSGFSLVEANWNDDSVMHYTLEEAVNRALSANRSIANAIDDITQASYSLRAAKSEFELQIFPEVYLDFSKGNNNYGAGLSFNKKLPIGTNISVNPSLQKTGEFYNANLDVVLTQPLFRGSGTKYNLYGVKQSDYYLRMSQRELYLTQVNIVMSTVWAVYEIVRRREILRLHQSSYDRSQGYAEAAEVKQKMKLATAIDVYRANIKLNQAESLLVSSREFYQDVLDNLKLILAVPLEERIEVSAPLKYTVVQYNEDMAIEISLRERVELQQFQDMIDNLELHSGIAKQNILPGLDLAISYSAQGSDAKIDQSLKSIQGDIEVGLVSSGNARKTAEKAEYQSSLLAVKSARRIFDLRQDEIKREVKFALRNLNRAEKNIDIQKEQIEQAKGKLELAKLKFARGMAGNFDLVEAETELREGEINLISAIIDYIVGQYNLRAILGTLIDKQGKVAI